MEHEPIDPAAPGVTWILSEAAGALGVSADPVRIAEAARLLPETPGWDDLERIAEASSLRLVRWQATARDAIAVASPRLPVVARAPDGRWLLVVDDVRGGARVRRGPDATRAEVLPVPILADQLGGSADTPLEWGLLEAATPFDPHGDAHAGHVSPWERLRSLVRAERRDIGIVVVYAIGIGVLSLAVPVAVQTLVNTVLFGTLLTPILWLSVLVLGGLVFAAVLQLAQVWVVEVLQRRVFVNLVAELAWRLPRTRVEALDRANAPVLVNRFFDVVALQKSISTLLLDGVAVLVASVAGTMLLAIYHPYLLGYAVVLWAALAALLGVTGRRGPETAIAESYAKHAVAGWMEELAANPQTFKHGGGHRWAWTRADALARAYLDARHAHFRVWFGQVAGLLLLYAVASTLLLALGGGLVIAGQLTIGQLMAAELVVAAVLGSFAKLGKQLEKLYDLLAALDKVGHLLEVPLDQSGGERLPEGMGPLGVEVRDLAYAYEGERPVLEGLSFLIRPGERVALLASGGSGKRTLLDLIVGARTPSRGWIRIGGVDVRDLRLDDLREHVALVRGTEIVDGTVAENVHLGRPGATPERVRSALARVGLLDEAAALPDGLRTHLAASGRPLSGSQARRLMLARALAGAPRLLLVDDLVDTLSGRARDRVLEALLGEARTATTVIVTRDPEVARRCDRIVELTRPAPPTGAMLRVGRVA
jgi:putative ABC transport system ATP-binding protein